MICFEKKKVKRIKLSDNWNKEVIDSNSECEMFLLYGENGYCGCIEKKDALKNYNLNDRIYQNNKMLYPDKNLIRNAKKIMEDTGVDYIPLQTNENVEEMQIFLCLRDGFWREADNIYLWYEEATQYGKNIPNILDGKGIEFEVLDEYTYKLSFLLPEVGTKIYIKDPIWKEFECFQEKDEKVCYLSEKEAGTFIQNYSEEHIYRIEDKYEGKQFIHVSIPQNQNLSNKAAVEDRRGIAFHTMIPRLFSLNKKEKIYLEKYCGRDYQSLLENYEIVSRNRRHLNVIGAEEANTVYLIGPCIVSGITTFEEDTIAHLLYQEMKDHQMSYNVKRVALSWVNSVPEKILNELDIKKGDYVIFFQEKHKKAEIDLCPLFENQPENELWFQDRPIHTTAQGNREIVKILMTFIKDRTESDGYTQIGKTMLSVEEKDRLKNWIRQQQEMLPWDLADKKVGAIVMNANPFTNGHRYLIENAAKEVDYLIVFAVQEDVSEFSFQDRLLLMRQGTKDLVNVFVIPSGEFVLSQYTMKAYFGKEKLQDKKVDAATDVNMFGNYIAPDFHISIRFVGEEPFDRVTRQYNEEMKIKLPYFGVDVVEIPRKKSDEMVISASLVRAYYAQRNWKEIEKIVPETTLDFLKKEPVIKEKSEAGVEQELSKMHELLDRNEKVILYAVGEDGLYLYENLNSDERDKVLFCDKTAEVGNISVFGKRVMKPDELTGRENCCYPIIITSTLYGTQIFADLQNRGIEKSRIYLNKMSSPK